MPRPRGSSGKTSTITGAYYADKDVFYRTTDVFNAIFKKKIRFEPSNKSCTDGNTIWVNMKNDGPLRTVVEDLYQEERKTFYRLDCGHVVRAEHYLPKGKELDCVVCGGNDAYHSFEHEWQHIIFKSMFGAESLFIDEYIKKLKAQLLAANPGLPGFDEQYLDDLLRELPQFLRTLINALDDVRCNSLWEKVYPGSASRIWARWQRLGKEVLEKHKQLGEDSFCTRVICIGVGLHPDKDSKYAHLDPYIEEAVKRARYKGFPNMLVVTRWLLENCINTLLNDFTPPPHFPNQSSPQQDQSVSAQCPQNDSGGSGDSQSAEDDGFSNIGDDTSQDQQQSADQQQSGTQPVPGQTQPPTTPAQPAPQSLQSSLQGNGMKAAKVLQSLSTHSTSIDPKEEHPLPSALDLVKDPSSKVLQAAVSKALSVDIDDPSIDQTMSAGQNQIDPDAQLAIHQLQSNQADKDKDSFLVTGAKASLRFIDVLPSGIRPTTKIDLTPEEKLAVNRVRASFFKAQGRQKAVRSSAGVEIDVQALIQHRIEPTDGEVFENESINRGFCYHILTDMSGSMYGNPFNQVCHATEMLKQSLRFPFVFGDLWGFRGADNDMGTVWVYRYDRRCDGYLGTGIMRGGLGGGKQVPVECGGLTPMHSAIHVSVKHLLTQPAGSIKRLFLLTDGSPAHGKVGKGGGTISEHFLKKLVAKEISYARQKNIQVYTLVIGDGIRDDEAFMMFGQERFWRRVSSQSNGSDSVDKVLTRLVLENFQRYLQAKG